MAQLFGNFVWYKYGLGILYINLAKGRNILEPKNLGDLLELLLQLLSAKLYNVKLYC